MNSSKMLRVVGVSEERQDKNGNTYKNIQVSSPVMSRKIDLDTGEVELVPQKARVSSFNVWKHSYLAQHQLKQELDKETLSQKEIETCKSDFGYDLQEGQKIEGMIVTRAVEPYLIVDQSTGEEREVSIYSAPVLGDTESPDFESIVKAEFKRNGHIVAEASNDVLKSAKIGSPSEKEEPITHF